MCVYVCVMQELGSAYHSTHAEVKGQLCGVSSFPLYTLMWVLGIQPRSIDLCGKHLYLVTHVSGSFPIFSFYKRFIFTALIYVHMCGLYVCARDFVQDSVRARGFRLP